MSDFSILLSRVRGHLRQKGVRYARIVASDNGATDGSTIISDDLTQLDDWWNGMQAVRLDANQEPEAERRVVDFTASTDTLDFTGNVWDRRIVTNDVIELFEPGSWRGDDVKRALEDGANWFLRLAPVDLLRNYAVRETIGGVAGTLDCPANVVKYVEPILTIEGKKVDILDPNEESYLTEGAYIETDGSYIGYYAGRSSAAADVGQFLYRPPNNQNGVWHFVPKAAFASDNSWKVPEELWEPVAFAAAMLLLLSNERSDLAEGWERQVFKYLPKQARTEGEGK